MSTNYYWQWNDPHRMNLHIGKSSAGWAFALHVMPDVGLTDLDKWTELFTKGKGRILSDSGRVLTAAEMMGIITDRSWPAQQRSAEFYAINQAEPGPNGLNRAVVDGEHCIGHGPGTWDLIAGDFS
jgi:hypothetical protein